MIITTKKEEEGGHIVVVGVDDDAFAEDQLRPGFDHIWTLAKPEHYLLPMAIDTIHWIDPIMSSAYNALLQKISLYQKTAWFWVRIQH